MGQRRARRTERAEEHDRGHDHRSASAAAASADRTSPAHGGSNRAHIAAATVHREPTDDKDDRGWLGELGALIGVGGSGIGAYDAVVEMINEMRTSRLGAEGFSGAEIESQLLPTDPRLKHLGTGFSALGEMAGRAERGESWWQAVGGGGVKVGVEQALGSDRILGELGGLASDAVGDAAEQGGRLGAARRGLQRAVGLEDVANTTPTGLGTASSVAGLVGAGLKLTGAMTKSPGEAPSGDWDWLGDTGDVVGTAGTFLGGGMSLLAEGITSGIGGAWTTGTNLVSGDAGAFDAQAKAQREGKAGPILQGYQMMADLATGDADKVGQAASSGEAGGLAKFGTKMGDAAFGLTEAVGLDTAAYEAVKWMDL